VGGSYFLTNPNRERGRGIGPRGDALPPQTGPVRQRSRSQATWPSVARIVGAPLAEARPSVRRTRPAIEAITMPSPRPRRDRAVAPSVWSRAGVLSPSTAARVGASGRPCPASVGPRCRGDRTRTATLRATRASPAAMSRGRLLIVRDPGRGCPVLARNYRFCASVCFPSVHVYYKRADPDGRTPLSRPDQGRSRGRPATATRGEARTASVAASPLIHDAGVPHDGPRTPLGAHSYTVPILSGNRYPTPVLAAIVCPEPCGRFLVPRML